MGLSPSKLFHKILMSEGFTPEMFKAEIRIVIANAKELEMMNPTDPPNVLVFIDELNTSVIMGVIKEIIMDRMIDGESLPENICFVGAINPYEAGEEADFVVHPSPPSMDVLQMQFSSLTPKQEEIFLFTYLRDKYSREEVGPFFFLFLYFSS